MVPNDIPFPNLFDVEEFSPPTCAFCVVHTVGVDVVLTSFPCKRGGYHSWSLEVIRCCCGYYQFVYLTKGPLSGY